MHTNLKEKLKNFTAMDSILPPTDQRVCHLADLLWWTQIGQSIYAKLWLNPPQIATEAFSSDLLPERSLE